MAEEAYLASICAAVESSSNRRDREQARLDVEELIGIFLNTGEERIRAAVLTAIRRATHARQAATRFAAVDFLDAQFVVSHGSTADDKRVATS